MSSSESDSKQERVEVSLLDSDDDDLFLDLPNHAAPSLHQPFSHSSSSSSSPSAPLAASSAEPLVKIEADSNDPKDPSQITANSAHSFSSYDDLKAFFSKYAAARGFQTKATYTGGVNSSSHRGSMKCWCSEEPPAVVEEEKRPVPSYHPLRQLHTKTSQHSGKQVKCGCLWVVKFSRREDGKYWLTNQKGSRVLEHNHPLLEPNRQAVIIDSLRNVTPALQEEVRAMITSGMHCGEVECRFLGAQHHLTRACSSTAWEGTRQEAEANA